MSERRYSEDEVALILRQATESRDPGTSGRGSDGLTLDELKGIGREVGIDPDAIEAAARHVAVTRVRGGGGFLGISATPRYESSVPGEIAPERLSEAVAVIRRGMGRQGIVRTEFGGLEWQARDAFGGRYASLQPEGGKTHIRVFGNFRDSGFLAVGIGGVPTGAVAAAAVASILKAAGLGALLGVGTLPVGFVAGALGARFLWKRFVTRETRALERTASELERTLAGGAASGDESLPGEAAAREKRSTE